MNGTTYSKRDTLFETFTRPSSETSDVSLDLKTQCQVEILRHVSFGPELEFVILHATSWIADHRSTALCPTKGATSPLATPYRMAE